MYVQIHICISSPPDSPRVAFESTDERKKKKRTCFFCCVKTSSFEKTHCADLLYLKYYNVQFCCVRVPASHSCFLKTIFLNMFLFFSEQGRQIRDFVPLQLPWQQSLAFVRLGGRVFKFWGGLRKVWGRFRGGCWEAFVLFLWGGYDLLSFYKVAAIKLFRRGN